MVAYNWWRGVACPPCRLIRGTMAAPLGQLPSNLYEYSRRLSSRCYVIVSVELTINIVCCKTSCRSYDYTGAQRTAFRCYGNDLCDKSQHFTHVPLNLNNLCIPFHQD